MKKEINLFRTFDLESEIKAIIQSGMAGTWKSSKEQALIYLIEADLPEELLGQSVKILFNTLFESHLGYLVEICGRRKIKLKKEIIWFANLRRLFDCSIRTRVSKFEESYLREMDEIIQFHNAALEKRNVLEKATGVKWYTNFEPVALPKVYFSTKHSFKKDKIESFMDSILTIKYGKETKLYPKYYKIHSIRKDKYSPLYDEVLWSSTIAKLVTSLIIWGIKDNLALMLLVIFLGKFPVSSVSDYFFKKTRNYLNNFSPIMVDLPLSIIMGSLILFLGRLGFSEMAAIFFDFSLNRGVFLVKKNRLIRESQELSRSLVTNLLNYYFSDYPLNITYVADPLQNDQVPYWCRLFVTSIKIFLEIIEMKQYLPNLPYTYYTNFDLLSLKFLQIDYSEELFNMSKDDKILFGIIGNHLYYFGVSLLYNKKIIFVFPNSIMSIGLNKLYFNKLVNMVEESFVIMKKLKKLKFDYNFYSKPTIFDHINNDCFGGVSLKNSDLDYEKTAILRKHFVIIDELNDGCLHLTSIKKIYKSEDKNSSDIKIKESKNKITDGKKNLVKEGDETTEKDKKHEVTAMPTKTASKTDENEENSKLDRSKSIVKVNKKITSICQHLRKKYKKIRIRTRPNSHIIQVDVSFQKLQEYLMDFESDSVKIKKGVYVILNYDKIHIKIYCKVTGNKAIENEYKNEVLKNNKIYSKKIKSKTLKDEIKFDDHFVSELEYSEKTSSDNNTEVEETDLETKSNGLSISANEIETNEVISMIPDLMMNLADEFKKLTGIEYDFLQIDQENIYRLWENYFLFSFYFYLSYPMAEIDAYGSHIIKTMLQLPVKKKADIDLRVRMPDSKKDNFNYEALFINLTKQANEYIVGYKASSIKTVKLYTVEMQEGDIIDVRFSEHKDIESDILKLDLVFLTLSVNVDWSAETPRITVHVPDCAKEFVERIRKGLPPPLQWVKNYTRAQELLNNLVIKQNVQSILESIYPKVKIKISLILKNLQEGKLNTGLPAFIEDVALYILNLVFDVKRIFRMFSAMDMVRFAANEWVDYLTGPQLSNLLKTSQLTYPVKTSEDKDYISFTDTVQHCFKKYFINNTNRKPPIVESFKTVFKFSEIILLLDAKINTQDQQKIQKICQQAPDILASVPSIRAYYIKLVKPLRIRGKNNTLINIFLILMTLSQKEIVANVTVNHSDPKTKQFVLETKLMQNFKQKLEENARLFQYPLDMKSIFQQPTENDFNYDVPLLSVALVAMWRPAATKGYFSCLTPFSLWESTKSTQTIAYPAIASDSSNMASNSLVIPD